MAGRRARPRGPCRAEKKRERIRPRKRPDSWRKLRRIAYRRRDRCKASERRALRQAEETSRKDAWGRRYKNLRAGEMRSSQFSKALSRGKIVKSLWSRWMGPALDRIRRRKRDLHPHH